MDIRIALVTCPDEPTAQAISSKLVEQRLAACVNIVPQITSIYRWEGKLETSRESLLVIKTTADRVATLEAAVLELHPYDTPEFVLLSADQVNTKYAAWVRDSVRE